MAIVRTAGSEIVRSAHFRGVDTTDPCKLIIGEQHHIYTVLSITAFTAALGSGGTLAYLKFKGFDAVGGTSAQTINIAQWSLVVNETFVWNDKFSFNGYEPVDEGAGVVGTMSTAAEQDAIADQGSSVAQYLYMHTNGDTSTDVRVMVTYIDQNNV